MPEGLSATVTMGDSDQTLSEYLASPGGGGITLPTKIQKVLHDALADAFDAKTAKEVQGYSAEIFVSLFDARVDPKDYPPAAAEIIKRWASDAPAQKRPVPNPLHDVKGSGGKDKDANDDDDLASLSGMAIHTELKADVMANDLRKMAFKTGAQATAFDVSIAVGRALEQSEVDGEPYGRDALLTHIGVLARKAKNGETLNEILVTKDGKILSDLFLNLIREYNGMGCHAEAKVLTDFWTQTQEIFGTDNKGLFEYMTAYRRKYRGRGLPEVLDTALVLRSLKTTDTSAMREELSKMKTKLEASERSAGELKSKVGNLETALNQLKSRVGNANPPNKPPADYVCSHCQAVGEHWSNRCPTFRNANGGGNGRRNGGNGGHGNHDSGPSE